MDDKRVLRVNVEVVYDDGTLDELALDKPTITLLRSWFNVSRGTADRYQSLELAGEVVPL